MPLASFQAGQSLTAGDCVYVSASGFLHKGSATSLESATVVGFCLDTVNAGDLARVQSASLFTELSGLTVGNSVYVGITSGTVVSNYNTWITQALATPNNRFYLADIGKAVSSSGVTGQLGKLILLNIEDLRP